MKVNKKVIAALGEATETALETFNKAFDHIESQFIERFEVIKLIKLALLTRQHVMLEGLHGLAKSMLAKAVFNCFSKEFKTFSVQLNKGRQIEELCGPMDAKRYKEKAEWYYNTANMLPEAHFAFIDEVYRATEHLLSSTMSLLNERVFFNGSKVMQCPLITAIGTTNFTPNTEELLAFHDRWLLRYKVAPIASAEGRYKLIEKFLHSDNITQPKNLISMEQLEVLQNAISELIPPKDICELLISLVGVYSKNAKEYISDRRLCFAARLVCADAVLNGALSSEDVTEGNIDAARFALMTINDERHAKAFDDAFANTVGMYARARDGRAEYEELLSESEELYEKFAPSNKELIPEFAEVLSKLSSFLISGKGSTEQKQKLTEMSETLAKCHKQLSAPIPSSAEITQDDLNFLQRVKTMSTVEYEANRARITDLTARIQKGLK